MHKKIGKAILFTVGILSTGLAILGVILPGLPTTIFLIIAAWCFARSSETFHTWLYTHKTFGPILTNWEKYRVVPVRAKTLMVVLMLTSVSILFYLYQTRVWIPVIVTAILLAVAMYVLRCPSKVPGKIKRQS